jgi:hypothetical protein
MFTDKPGFFKDLVTRKLPEYFEGKLGLKDPMIKYNDGEVKKIIQSDKSLNHPQNAMAQA